MGLGTANQSALFEHMVAMLIQNVLMTLVPGHGK